MLVCLRLEVTKRFRCKIKPAKWLVIFIKWYLLLFGIKPIQEPILFKYHRSKHSSWWRLPEDVFRLRSKKTSSGRLQNVLIKTNIIVLVIPLQDVFKTSSKRLQDVFKTPCKNVFKTSSRRFQDIFKTTSRRIAKASSRYLQDVFKTFSRSLQDIFKTFWRRLQDVFKMFCKDLFKTFSKRIIKLNCSC